MATYAYHCATCGPFDVRLPLGDADGVRPCPHCGEQARRVFTPPFLARTGALVQHQQRAEASSDTPEVVDAVPPAARRRAMTPTNPKWASLPRP